MLNNNPALLVEEAINNLVALQNCRVRASGTIDDAVDDAIDGLRRSRTNPMQFIEPRLLKLGFVRKDGSADYVKFYTSIEISKDVWSTMTSFANIPKKDSLLKFAVGLQLNKLEVEHFFAIWGQAINYHDEREITVIACLQLEIYEKSEINARLEERGKRLAPLFGRLPKEGSAAIDNRGD